MRYFILLLVFASYNITNAQSINLDYGTIDSIVCPNDSNQFQYELSNWEVYQTVDDTWQGERDTTNCIQLFRDNFLFEVDLSSINLDKALFVRYKLEALTEPALLKANSGFSIDNPAVVIQDLLKTGMDCSQNLCSGLFWIT